METTALTDNKTVMYTSEQVQQMLDMVVRSLSNQGQKSSLSAYYLEGIPEGIGGCWA